MSLNRNFIAPLLVAVPRRAEQQAIAEALSDADALIESLEQLLAKKRRIKQGALQELLTGKKRLPGFGGEWEVRALRFAASVLSGQHVPAQDCNSDGVGYPYITGPADFPGGVISHTKSTERPTTICRDRDILVTVKGSGVGTIIIADGSYCISRQLMAVRVGHSLDARFLLYSLLRDSVLLGAAASGVIPGIARSALLNKSISSPPLAEQKAISSVLSDMDEEIAVLEAELAKSRLLKQGMMQELLTGRIRLV